jgi:CcmD family protein
VTTLASLQSAPAGTAQPPTEFVPVEGGTETTSAETLLVAAYLVMWAVLLGFVLLSWRRQQSLEGRLGALERALGKVEENAER